MKISIKSLWAVDDNLPLGILFHFGLFLKVKKSILFSNIHHLCMWTNIFFIF